MRELKFKLDVQSDALLCPNPSEWFAKSYIQQNVADNFRTIPGVKEATKVAVNIFDELLQTAGCVWAPVDTVLDAEEVGVCKLDAMVQLCQYDLERAFISEKMAAGDTNFEEADFLSHFWEELTMAVAEEIQLIRWNGDTALPGGTLSLCDGYLTQLQLSGSSAEKFDFASPNQGAAITKNNIIDVLAGVIGKLPEAVKANKGNIRIYMSETNAFYYQLATLGLNSNFNYTGELGLSFAGYTISVQAGMNDKFIVAGNKNSFAYAFDGEGDESNLKIVNMMDTAAEPVIRARVGLKLGFKLLNNADEVAYYEAI